MEKIYEQFTTFGNVVFSNRSKWSRFSCTCLIYKLNQFLTSSNFCSQFYSFLPITSCNKRGSAVNKYYFVALQFQVWELDQGALHPTHLTISSTGPFAFLLWVVFRCLFVLIIPFWFLIVFVIMLPKHICLHLVYCLYISTFLIYLSQSVIHLLIAMQ